MKPITLLAIVLALGTAAYGLSRGIFIGSAVVQFTSAGGTYLGRECRYLFPSGVTTLRKGGWTTRQEAENEFCQLFMQQ